MNILGISGVFGHDAAACLCVNGEVIAYAEEERFSRKRFSFGDFPIESTRYCLQEANLSIEEIDILAVSIDPHLDKEASLFQEYGERFLSEFSVQKKYWPIVEYWNHHLCHTASSYYSSGFEKAVSLVIDGNGELSSTSIHICQDGEIIEKEALDISQSLGHFYKSVCMYTGLGRYSEGKLMGLAAYGNPIYPFSQIDIDSKLGYSIGLGNTVRFLPQEHRYQHIQNEWMNWLEANFGAPNLAQVSWSKMNGFSNQTLFSKKYKDIAASAQETLNQAIEMLLRYAVEKYKITNVCISGGVGLNCSTNGYLTEKKIAESIYIVPVANDAGGALGAAYLSSKKNGSNPGILKTVYLGPDYTEGEVTNLLDQKKIPYYLVENSAEFAAEKIISGNVIGWFQGKMEIGPRALGNRSILAMPNNIDIRDKVNLIKGREDWRPLSPSILEEEVLNYVDFKSEFMLRGLHVKEERKHEIIGAVHVDGTARVQSVSKQKNVKYHKLLQHIKEKTGVGAVLNTSFNIRGEPLVCSPRDAIKTFYDSELDYLIIGNIILEKNITDKDIYTQKSLI